MSSVPVFLSRPRRSYLQRCQRQLRYLYLKFIRLRGHPKELARGLAAGVFAGMFPLFGLQTLIGVAISFRIKGNPLMAAAGTWVSNPLTYVPIYAFNYQLGCWLLRKQGGNPFTDLDSLKSWLETGTDIGVALMLGSFVMGIVFGVGSYFVSLPLIRRARRGYRTLRHLGNHE